MAQNWSLLKDLPDRWDAAYQALKADDPKAPVPGVLETVGKEDMPEEYWEDWGKFKAFLKRHREHLRDYRTKLRQAGIHTSGMSQMAEAQKWVMQAMAELVIKGGYS